MHDFLLSIVCHAQYRDENYNPPFESMSQWQKLYLFLVSLAYTNCRQLELKFYRFVISFFHCQLLGSIMFHVRRRPADSQPRRRKKKPLGVSNGGNSASSDREGPVLMEITHSGEGGRHVKLTSEPIEVSTALRIYQIPLVYYITLYIWNID